MAQTPSPPNRITRACLFISGIALCTMMLVVVGDVVLRAVFNSPIQGAYDVVSISLLVMTFFGIAPVVADRREILIDIIDSFLPARALKGLGLVSGVAGAALFLFFGWSMLDPALDAWRWGERSLELGIPKWPIWAIAFLGLAGIIWAFVLQLLATRRTPAPAPSEEGGL